MSRPTGPAGPSELPEPSPNAAAASRSATAVSPEGTAGDSVGAPVGTPGNTGGATLALLEQSRRAVASGQLLEAIAYAERAIRINPRNAALWIQLAELQLANQQPRTAEQYASKALTLAAGAVNLQRDAWLVIADAKQALGDAEEAAAIRLRWQTQRG